MMLYHNFVSSLLSAYSDVTGNNMLSGLSGTGPTQHLMTIAANSSTTNNSSSWMTGTTNHPMPIRHHIVRSAPPPKTVPLGATTILDIAEALAYDSGKYHNLSPAETQRLQQKAIDEWVSMQGGGFTYVTKKGYAIKIKEDGSYEIEAPQNLDLVDFVKAHPRQRLMDRAGNIIVLAGSPYVQKLSGYSSHNIAIVKGGAKLQDSLAFNYFNKIAIPNTGLCLALPNDAELHIDPDGNIEIEDKNAKVSYKSAPRNFNKFLNTSDVLEDFIRYLGSLQVRQHHVMKLPLGLFINWLIIRAAETDGDDASDLKPALLDGVQQVKRQPRCRYCARFIPRVWHDEGVNFCSPEHMGRFTRRLSPMARKRLPVLAPPSATYFAPAA